MSALAGGLMRLYFGYIEPLQTAARQRRRLQACGLAGLSEVSSCPTTTGPLGATCGEHCRSLIGFHRQSIAKFLTAAQRDAGGDARFHPVPSIIALGAHADHGSYMAVLRRKSGGNLARDIAHAQARYHCRPINRQAHAGDIHAAATSLRFRTGGPVLSALLSPRAAKAAPPLDPAAAVSPPACPVHYAMDWGVFLNTSDDAATGGREKLVGYVFLRRVGNGIRVIEFMGHGAHLHAGAMKLLFSEVMRWLLERRDPAVQGLDFIQYGAIEHGAAGLLQWKRRFGFAPAVFDHQSGDK